VPSFGDPPSLSAAQVRAFCTAAASRRHRIPACYSFSSGYAPTHTIHLPTTISRGLPTIPAAFPCLYPGGHFLDASGAGLGVALFGDACLISSCGLPAVHSCRRTNSAWREFCGYPPSSLRQTPFAACAFSLCLLCSCRIASWPLLYLPLFILWRERWRSSSSCCGMPALLTALSGLHTTLLQAQHAFL